MFNLNHFQPNRPPIKTRVDLDELDLFEYLSKNIKYLNFNFNNKQQTTFFGYIALYCFFETGGDWLVGKSDFNENPVISLDLYFGLRLRVCQKLDT